MGLPPRWFLTMRAARYLGISFFKMKKKSILWRTRALMAQAAEEWVEEERRKKRGPQF